MGETKCETLRSMFRHSVDTGLILIRLLCTGSCVIIEVIGLSFVKCRGSASPGNSDMTTFEPSLLKSAEV